MRIKKVTEDELKITTEVVSYIKRAELIEKKLSLETRLAEINGLLNNFTEGK